MRIVSIAILVSISLSCSRPPETIAAWRDMLRLSSDCTTAPLLLPTWPARSLTSPPGELHLPPSFRSAGTDGTESLWVGLDSSEVAYVLSAEPSSVMAGRSPPILRLRGPSYRRGRAWRFEGAGGDGVIHPVPQL